MNFSEATLADAVVSRMDCEDERFKSVMTSLIRSLHAFVREVEPTEEEWLKIVHFPAYRARRESHANRMAAIRFLTQTGQRSDDKRAEFILLSDVLGVSSLVDVLNHRHAAAATASTVLGPFHVNHDVMLPLWGDLSAGQAGSRSFVSGKVLDTEGRPVEGVLMDLWQTDGEKGVYDVQLDGDYKMFGRGRFLTGEDGVYAFRHVKPIPYPIPTDGPVGDMLSKMGRHPMRPAHVHAILRRQGFRTLTTHLFVKGDPYNNSDAVFGVKESLIVDFIEHPPGPTPDGGASEVAFFWGEFNFVMERE